MPRISKQVIGCAMEVHRCLGCGFLEAVYENSLIVEFQRAGINLKRQVPFHIHYKGRSVGYYVADFVIENNLLLELKATKQLTQSHEIQTLNYLNISGITVGLLLNFGSPSLQVKRLVKDYKMAQKI